MEFSGKISSNIDETNKYGFKNGSEVFGAVVATEITTTIRVPLKRLNHKPNGLSFDEAASLYLASCAAFQCLDSVQLLEGERVLILGGDCMFGVLMAGVMKNAGASW